jgi:hypothetical protein
MKIFGITLAICVLLSTGSGMLSAGLGRFLHTKPWQHHKEVHNKIGKLHKLFGNFVIVLGFVTTIIGLFAYMNHYPGTRAKRLTIAYMLVYPSFAIIFEVGFRYWRRNGNRELAVRPNLKQISVDTFKSKVFEQKKSWWILDNCVLDNDNLPPIGHYDHFHPGGRFTLTKNFGRDISKYFYGGYVLVNSAEGEKVHNHSHTSMQVCNNMVIANLLGQGEVRPYLCNNAKC